MYLKISVYVCLITPCGMVIDVCISTDIIAGFCDESEEEHRESLSLMAEVAFDQAFMFAYSLRDKTHAGQIHLTYNIKNLLLII